QDRGLLLIDDFGDLTFGRALEIGIDQQMLWSAALDGLLALRANLPPERLPVPGGTPDHILHRYDRTALTIEVELLTDWYWPAVKGTPIPADVKAEFLRLWNAQIDWLETLPLGWVIRDYHSPNLMWLSDGRVGVLDFQDAMRGPWAYDVVSLLQDARLDVPEDVERALLNRYRHEVAQREPDFDSAAFDSAYAVLGAERGLHTETVNAPTSRTCRASGGISSAICATPLSPISRAGSTRISRQPHGKETHKRRGFGGVPRLGVRGLVPA
ncbi:MAG: phosphotransferase, partial [Hyphomicrobium sp.]|nr:phosphotransferase [Hyphomicrobium sp.]